MFAIGIGIIAVGVVILILSASKLDDHPREFKGWE